MEKLRSGTLLLIFLTLFQGCSSGQNALLPGLVNGAVGGNVTFTPNVNLAGSKFQVVTWDFINGSEFKDIIISGPNGSTPTPGYAGRVSVNRTTGSLELRELTLRDTGVYKVTLNSRTGTQLTGESTLNVYEPVSNVTVRANATELVEFNDTVSLACSADGTSLLYQWYNGSYDITASEHITLKDDNRTLIISNVLRSDHGPLYCMVSNAITKDTNKPLYLNISYGPDHVRLMINGSSDNFFPVGSNLTLFCSAQSSPPAEFKWAFDTMILTEGQELKLENIMQSDSGDYTCWAHNIRTLRYSSLTEAISISGSHTELVRPAIGVVALLSFLSAVVLQ